jgi:hypothetical protein
MTLNQLYKLIPMLPDIEKAVATAKIVLSNPDVQAALKTGETVFAIVSAPDTAAGQDS